MKHQRTKQTRTTSKLLLLLLALAMMLTATQCAPTPPPEETPLDAVQDEEVPDDELSDESTPPDDWPYADCDTTSCREFGRQDDFIDHEIIIEMAPGYMDKEYTIEDFPEVECVSVRVLMTSRQPEEEATWSQMLLLTLATHSKKGVLDAIERLNQREDVTIAETNDLMEMDIAPNDTAYLDGTQWAIDKIQLPDAWNISTGSNTILVGIIDSGIAASHPELSSKVNATLSISPSPDYTAPLEDAHGHGTKVAGVIGAATNNSTGIAGATWNVQLVSLRVGYRYYDPETGEYSHKLHTDAIVEAIVYAAEAGIPILNLSGGRYTWKTNLHDAIANYPGIFICSAGNDGLATDTTPHYPSGYDLPNIISVGASESDDEPWSDSNYGYTTVDLFAPGANIYTTTNDGEYDSTNGTSLAAPYVSGVAALMLSVRPHLTPANIKSILMSSVETPNIDMLSLCASGGRLNAYNALLQTIQTHAYSYTYYSASQHIASCACGNHTAYESHNWTIEATQPMSGEYSPDYVPLYVCTKCGYTSLQPMSTSVTE